MANASGKEIDKTFLSLDTAEKRGFIHRDYIAHCLRWSHVIKYLQQGQRYSSARVLDIGCGREAPLPKTLYSARLIVESYIGVDYGPIDKIGDIFHTGKFPVEFFPKTDILDFTCATPNVVTCFEVLEHVEPLHMVKMLRHIKDLIDPKGVAFFSTPCYDAQTGAANNHVNEITHDALAATFERTGWRIMNHWGTFASIKDYTHKMSAYPGLAEVFERLRAYYDVNYLSTVFAPLFPENSRNCLWELSPDNSSNLNEFKPLAECATPWGSSERWRELNEG